MRVFILCVAGVRNSALYRCNNYYSDHQHQHTHQTIVYFDNNRAHVTMAMAMKSVLSIWAQDSRLPQDDPENWWDLPFSLENPALLV